MWFKGINDSFRQESVLSTLKVVQFPKYVELLSISHLGYCEVEEKTLKKRRNRFIQQKVGPTLRYFQFSGTTELSQTTPKPHVSLHWSQTTYRSLTYTKFIKTFCVMRFQGTRLYAILFTPVRTVQPSLRWFSRNAHIISSIICRSLIYSLAQTGQKYIFASKKSATFTAPIFRKLIAA